MLKKDHRKKFRVENRASFWGKYLKMPKRSSGIWRTGKCYFTKKALGYKFSPRQLPHIVAKALDASIQILNNVLLSVDGLVKPCLQFRNKTNQIQNKVH